MTDSESMDYFQNHDKQFKFNEWKKWRSDCLEQGKLLDPSNYKD